MTTTIEIPTALDEQVASVVQDMGYASKSEFVRDAVRRRLEEVD